MANSSDTCGCCEGIDAVTPQPTANRPGLQALAYRVGTHSTFLESMKARLSSLALDITRPDGAQETLRPLENLRTRAVNDPSIALLDTWASVAAVLTFYQERIANEGYLRTATERRSVLELARLIGYALKPGVAASAWLALELDRGHDVMIRPYEIKAQSAPGPGELPQTFENGEPLDARYDWNKLQPRRNKPQKITLDNVQLMTKLYFEGTALNLKPNDPILLVFGDEISEQVTRSIREATPQFDEKRTEVKLQAVPILVVTTVVGLRTAKDALEEQFREIVPNSGNQDLIERIEETLLWLRLGIENLSLGNYPPIHAEYFSHTRIYNFLGDMAGTNRRETLLSKDEIYSLFSRQMGWGGQFRRMIQADPDIDPLTILDAVLDKALALLQDETFRHEWVCFLSSVITQARPLNPPDKMTVMTLLAQITSKQVSQITEVLQGLQLPQSPEKLEAIRKKVLALLYELTVLLHVEESFDSLNGLFADLLELSNTSELTPAHQLIQMAQTWLNSMPKGSPAGCEPGGISTSVGGLVTPLAKPPSRPPANSARLARNTTDLFQPRADNAAQLLVGIDPRLADTFYRAWANAAVSASRSPLKSVHALRLSAAPFGHNAPLKMGLKPNEDPNTKNEFPLVSGPDGDWTPEGESPGRLFLDAAYDAVQPQSYVVIQKTNYWELLTRSASRSDYLLWLAARVEEVTIHPRTAYGITGETTELALSREWWNPNRSDGMNILRKTTVYAQSEELHLAEELYVDDIQGQRIELNELYGGLDSGRWLIISGERTDIEGTAGVRATELAMLSSVEQQFDESLPGDKTRTTIRIANPLAYRYKRDTVTIYGNVVKATHGETRRETLGSGDASQIFQSFTLKQPPLTFVSAPTPAGTESTLKVYVDDMQWREANTLADLGGTDRRFVTKTDDESKTTVIFGNGQHGARLPTDVENVRAVYRNGIGRLGNVRAGQISLLLSKPLGLKGVTNPLRASGGADKESRDTARKNAPLAVNALDRLVSVSDYADFARTFAGIGKAVSARISDGRREVVHVTIAGADDIPIDETSDLHRNLLRSLHDFGDPYQPIALQTRELMLLVLSANIRILPEFEWETVVKAARAHLLETFSFERRELGQDVHLSEVIAAVQSIRGVAYVDIDVFGSIPEKKPDVDSQGRAIRRLLTPEDVSATVAEFLNAGTSGKLGKLVRVNLAGFEEGTIRPAQLAYLTPDVPDALVLNQIM